MNNTAALRDRIAQAFDSWMDQEGVGKEIAFHITDWDHNLRDLVTLYENPSISDDELRSIVIQFLAHVPNHVAAAKKLVGLGPIEDVFEVGVLREDD